MSEPQHAKEFGADTSLSPDSIKEASKTGQTVKALSNSSVNEACLIAPLQESFGRTSSSTFSDASTYSTDNENDGRGRLLLPSNGDERYPSKSPVPVAPTKLTWKRRLSALWVKDKGLALVMLSQLFGVMMNVTTRLLEMDGAHGKGMHPFQILFARMTVTLILSSAYQYFAKVEFAPFGPREVWKLLLARGISGFFGVYGMYYSLEYLPLSDATVITFLAPIVACWACSVLIHEPFTRSEQIAGIVSLLGVILIARPTSLLHSASGSSTGGSGGTDGLTMTNSTKVHPDSQALDEVTPSQRLSAVGVALVGVLGAACAYTTIRWIGQRAHPLISVNYFAAWSTVVSTIALLTIPGIGFRLPASLTQWAYLLFLGICGFVMQFLLTAGLSYEKSSRATNMVYTQMLFALAFDKLVWGTTPGVLSIVGSSLILGSALYVAVHNSKVKESGKTSPEGREEEELGLMDDINEDNESVLNDGRRPFGGVQEMQLRTIRV